MWFQALYKVNNVVECFEIKPLRRVLKLFENIRFCVFDIIPNYIQYYFYVVIVLSRNLHYFDNDLILFVNKFFKHNFWFLLNFQHLKSHLLFSNHFVIMFKRIHLNLFLHNLISFSMQFNIVSSTIHKVM